MDICTVDGGKKRKGNNMNEELLEKLKDKKAIKATLKDVSHLLPGLFFHRVDGGGDKAFIKVENKYCIVIPIAECCPIQILSVDALKEDLNGFEQELEKENNKQLLELQKRKDKLKEIKNGLDSK